MNTITTTGSSTAYTLPSTTCACSNYSCVCPEKKELSAYAWESMMEPLVKLLKVKNLSPNLQARANSLLLSLIFDADEALRNKTLIA